MSILNNEQRNSHQSTAARQAEQPSAPPRRSLQALGGRFPTRVAGLVLFALALGLGGGFLLGRRYPAATAADRAKIKLPDSFMLPALYGNIGPALLAVGAIGQERFVKLYAAAGQPLTGEQLTILTIRYILLGLSAVVTAGDVLTPIIAYLWPFKQVTAAGGEPVAVASTTDLPVGQGKVYSVANKPVIVIHMADG